MMTGTTNNRNSCLCGQPQNVCGQPQNVCGQPQNVCGQPQNMCSQPQNREQLMRQIYESSFAVNEAVLFLDTHPDCGDALRYYREAAAMRRNAVDAYQRQFGPLTSNDITGSSWTWIDGKWPWEGGC